MKYIASVEGKEFIVEIINDKQVIIDGETYDVDFENVHGQPVYSLIVGGKSYEAYVYADEGEWQVLMRGNLYQIKVEDEREKRLRAASGGGVAERGEFHLKAPMPGLVVEVPVTEGQEIQKGDVLVILESMKMQNELKAPRDGTITRIRVKPGDSVEQKQTMLSVE
jgi:biotin carboxyl carrier protein